DPELYPGGVDALPDDPEDNGLGRDLDPDNNPADDAVPDEISEPDDKPQAPEGDAEDAEADTTGEDVTDTDKAGDRASEPSD
ncbi:MAG TPA: hypothetical protein VGV65_01500, partial [Nocardioides sp.]|nr:hypothetical protein [Nocardioides sp.]